VPLGGPGGFPESAVL